MQCDIHVSFWGTRGSISTPGIGTQKYGGNTSCVSVKCGSTIVVLDAGTGIRNLGNELVAEATHQGQGLDLHLFLSHTHWDHIQGLPFFTPAYIPGTRLSIYGSPSKGEFLSSILGGQMDMDYFPVQMNQLAADIKISEMPGAELVLGDMRLDWQEQTLHPGGSVRYRIRAGGKTIVYATDVELDKVVSSDHENAKEIMREYHGFVRDADLLIADGQYTGGQYQSKIGYGHTSIPCILATAYEQKVKQLALFHHDPDNSDVVIDGLWSEYAPEYGSKSPAMNVFWAREGLTMVV